LHADLVDLIASWWKKENEYFQLLSSCWLACPDLKDRNVQLCK